jgi:disulfide bond formation protein DsbB
MAEFTSIVNILWAVLTVVANILSVVLIVSILSPKFRTNRVAVFFERKALLIAFAVSFLATLGSLIYSDIIGYDPCKLCWFQRIFMYPQVILFGIAAYKNNLDMKIYGLVLSIIGGAIALFHYIGQLGFNPFGLECLAIGYSASCAKNFVLQFGYVTIPMMALSAFVLIILTLCIKTSPQSSQVC